MDSQSFLKGKRPLSKEEVSQIRQGVSRPNDVDQTLFDSLLDNFIEKYLTEIIGIETNPEVLSALASLEVSEEDRANRLQIKLTQTMREASNFPSARNDHIPKYYEESEVPNLIKQWIDRLDAEVLKAFDLTTDFAQPEEIELFLINWNSGQALKVPPPLIEKLKERIVDNRAKSEELENLGNHMSLIASRRLPKYPDEYELLSGITEFLTGEVQLSDFPDKIESLIAGLDYAGRATEEKSFVKVDPTVAREALEATRKDLKRQLRRLKIPLRHLPRLEQLIQERFKRSIILPGAWVGNMMASSFGEAATQANLNTFHAAGDRAARKQITGFPKFKSILNAVENPQSNTITIFLKELLDGDQLRTRIPRFQRTTLADLIEGHRIIPSNGPQPRWEHVHDVLYGISYDVTYSGKFARRNLNRGNPIFSSPSGRLLEIKLNSREMFFRRISMSQISNAIEERSSDYRVTTSSIDIGIIYVYFKFDSISNISSSSGEQEPAFIGQHKFDFALNNLIYPGLISTQVGGVAGIEYVGVQYFEINKAIESQNTEMETNTQTRQIKIAFSPEKTVFWGLTPNVIRNFILTKIRRFVPRDIDIHFFYDEDNSVVTFHTAGMRFYDDTRGQYIPITLKHIQDELKGKTKVRASELLRQTRIPASANLRQSNPDPISPNVSLEDKPISEQQRVALEEFQRDDIPSPIRIDPNDQTGSNILIEFDDQILNDLGFDLIDIANTFRSIFSWGSNDAEVHASFNSSSFILKNVVVNPEKTNGRLFPNPISFVVSQMTEIFLTSNRIIQNAMRWYFSAEGKNYAEILTHPDVDSEYTRTDNIVETYRTLGVESTRSVLLEEIAASNDTKLNPAHIELLADSMTYRTPGDKPLGQNHYGMSKRGAEFVGLMWESTTKVVMRAGLGQEDHLQSFPSRIMMGLLSESGQMTAEDREEILKDRQVFALDRPPEVKIEEAKPDIELGSEIQSSMGVPTVVIEKTSKGTGLNTNLLRHPKTREPKSVPRERASKLELGPGKPPSKSAEGILSSNPTGPGFQAPGGFNPAVKAPAPILGGSMSAPTKKKAPPRSAGSSLTRFLGSTDI